MTSSLSRSIWVRLRVARESGQKKQSPSAAVSSSDAMVNPQSPHRDQQVLTPMGSEPTTSLLVVLIIYLRARVQAGI